MGHWSVRLTDCFATVTGTGVWTPGWSVTSFLLAHSTPIGLVGLRTPKAAAEGRQASGRRRTVVLQLQLSGESREVYMFVSVYSLPEDDRSQLL